MRIATLVGKPENLAFGQQVADDAITLVRDNGKVLPLKCEGNRQGRSSVYNKRGDSTTRWLRWFFPTMCAAIPAALSDASFRPDSGCARDLRGSADRRRHERRSAEGGGRGAGGGRGGVRYPDRGQDRELDGHGRRDRRAAAADSRSCRGKKPQSSPWGTRILRRIFPRSRIICVRFPTRPVSESGASQGVCLERSPIRGHLPVSIPNIAARGRGHRASGAGCQ